MKKQISTFWMNLIVQTIGFLKILIAQKVEDEVARKAWLLTLEPTDKIVAALADDNPDNKSQIAIIVKQHASTNVIPYAEEELSKMFDKIADEKVRAFVKLVGEIPFAVGIIYTDDKPTNLSQLKTYLEGWLESSTNQEVMVEQILLPLIKAIFKDNSFIADYLIKVLAEKLKTINIDLDGDGE